MVCLSICWAGWKLFELLLCCLGSYVFNCLSYFCFFMILLLVHGVVRVVLVHSLSVVWLDMVPWAENKVKQILYWNTLWVDGCLCLCVWVCMYVREFSWVNVYVSKWVCMTLYVSVNVCDRHTLLTKSVQSEICGDWIWADHILFRFVPSYAVQDQYLGKPKHVAHCYHCCKMTTVL